MKQMPGRFLAVLCSSMLIHDMQMVCDFFFLELITGVISANEIIQYPAFCRILWHFSLSLGMKLMEQILQSPRLGDLG
jgi:hypothetical protein